MAALKKPILVCKFGTSSITQPDGTVDVPVLQTVGKQLAELNTTHRILIVSSGAVGAGKGALAGFRKTLTQRKAAAAVGNPKLIATYAQVFTQHNIDVAQILCERSHFADHGKFTQLRQTLETLWENNIIPIANENDVVSNLELKFSDNDELAVLLSGGLGAEALLIGTSVPGLLDENNNVVPHIESFTETILNMANDDVSSGGLGGMITKLSAAHRATRLGVRVVLYGVHDGDNSLTQAYAGTSGTQCPATVLLPAETERWRRSGAHPLGVVYIDDGATQALKQRKSLLAVGVTHAQGDWAKGELIEIYPKFGTLPIARARAKCSASALKNAETKAGLTVAHTDHILLL